jgi:hypothetical protein
LAATPQPLCGCMYNQNTRPIPVWTRTRRLMILSQLGTISPTTAHEEDWWNVREFGQDEIFVLHPSCRFKSGKRGGKHTFSKVCPSTDFTCQPKMLPPSSD